VRTRVRLNNGRSYTLRLEPATVASRLADPVDDTALVRFQWGITEVWFSRLAVDAIEGVHGE